MTTERDVARALDLWLADGYDRVNDHVLDVVEGRVRRQRQRPGWRLAWRDAPMNSYLKLAAGVAAVLVVGVVGWQLLPDIGGPWGSATAAPSPGSSPSAAPTPTLTATGPVALPDGPLAGGTYLMEAFIAVPTTHVVADVPAGWRGVPEVPALIKPDENTGILIAGMTADGLFSDPCHWDLDGTQSIDQLGDVAIGPTVDDLVGALRANTSYTSSAATPVTIDGYEGQELELQLPGHDVISTCDRRPGQSTGDYFVFPRGFYALSSDSRWQLFILDVDGTRLVILVSIAPTAAPADVAAARAIVESFEITP